MQPEVEVEERENVAGELTQKCSDDPHLPGLTLCIPGFGMWRWHCHSIQ